MSPTVQPTSRARAQASGTPGGTVLPVLGLVMTSGVVMPITVMADRVQDITREEAMKRGC